MNARTPYWPLFRNEIGVDHCPKITWLLAVGLNVVCWVLVSSVPLLLLFKVSEGNLATFFAAFGDLIGFALAWWLTIAGWLFAFALFPGFSNQVQSIRAFEFMFTRAVDRRRMFRARIAVIYLVMLAPLLANILVSAGSPEPTLGPDASDAVSSLRRHEQYVKTFPDSYVREGKSALQPGPTVIPRGAVVLTAWIFWLGAFCLVLMQGYCAALVGYLQHNPWLAGGAVVAPIILFGILMARLIRHHPNLNETVFLSFARNLAPLYLGLGLLAVVVHVFSERKFKQSEIH